MYQLKEREIKCLERVKEIDGFRKEVAEIHRKAGDYRTVVKIWQAGAWLIKRELNRFMSHDGLRCLMREKGISSTYRKVWEPAKGRCKAEMARHLSRWAKW